LTIPFESVEALSDALLATGALAVDVADAYAGTPQERALFESASAGFPGWELAQVSALFIASTDVEASIARALNAAGLDPAQSFDVSHIEDRDWIRATQNQFGPVQISQRLWVVPTWCMPPDPKAINLFIDPGLAFGTGTHPTTQLCLAWLDIHLRGGEAVLDYGCGSGILAIAAVKLGATSTCGVDIDPAALMVARHNAKQNRTNIMFETTERPITGLFDIVLANILSGPLQLLAPLLARATRGGGHIVLSGILESQEDEVADVYRRWFNMSNVQHEAGWALLHGTRYQN